MDSAMWQTGFDTERLVLRPRRIADTDACLAMDREPGTTRFIAGPWDDPAAHRAFVVARTRGPWPPGMGYWTIVPRDGTAAFAGWIMLIRLDGTGPEIEIGWRLRRCYRGRGFASEAARPVLDHALTCLGLEEVVADIHPDNAASARVAEKVGMIPRGARVSAGTRLVRYVRDR